MIESEVHTPYLKRARTHVSGNNSVGSDLFVVIIADRVIKIISEEICGYFG